MASENRATRKRGVRASRVRLYAALADAGLKTQAALAERIADLEGLDAAPKDVVNRVFRELPVELHTLERVARALDVEAWTLYRSSRDRRPAAATEAGRDGELETRADEELPPHRPQLQRPFWPVAVLAGVALLIGGWWKLGPGSGSVTEPVARLTGSVPLGLGRQSVVVLPLAGDVDGRLTASLREELADTFGVASSGAALLAPADAAAAAGVLRADLSIDGEIVTVNRLTGIRLYLYAGGVRQQVWGDSVPTALLDGQFDRLSAAAGRAVRRAVGQLPREHDAGWHFPLAPAQDDYLEGRMHLDRPTTELNVKRAQSRFAAALRKDANYAQAHAGMCEALLEEHWMEDEQRALQDAALACGRALQLDPEDPVVQIAHAHFLRLTGRMPDAVLLFEQVIDRQPGNAFALEGLATTHFHAFRQAGDRAALEAAIDAAERAATADPLAWKVLSRLAQMRMLAGDLDGAVVAIERALERDENEHVLANAGTLRFCAGDVETARNRYLRAREVAPDSYVGEEFLGMLHYFLGEYEEAAELRRRAIERVTASREPEIHQMWGNLADAYRQSGRIGAALEAYRRAVEIAERDFLRGTATVSDRVYRAYYYTMLRAFAPEAGMTPVVAMVDQEIQAELLAAEPEATEPASFLRLAQSWMQHGELERARTAMDRAVGFCVGFRYMPDLAELATPDFGG